jgi:hypothetical protein
MPLRALVNGKPLTSVAVAPPDWDRLAREARAGSVRVTMPCCRGRGFLRRSVRHVQHFVHQPGAACMQKRMDSGDYAEILAILHRAAGQSGLRLDIETQAAGIPVPALLRLPGRRGRLAVLGFEQKYTYPQLLRIQARLAAQHVRGCWLLVCPAYDQLGRGAADPSSEPVFRIEKKPDGWRTCLRGGMPLSVFLLHLFQGHFRFVKYAVSQRAEDLRFLLYRVRCPHCGQPSAVYRLNGDRLSRCDLPLGTADVDRFRLEVVAAVRTIATETQLPLGHIAILDRSNPPGGFIACPACRRDLREADGVDGPTRHPAVVRTEKVVWKKPPRYPFPHWCFSVSRRFCG